MIDYASCLVLHEYCKMLLHEPIDKSYSSSCGNSDERHECNTRRSFYEPYQTAGLLGFTVSAAPEITIKMATDTIKELHSLRTHGVEAQLLVLAKQRASMHFSNSHSDNIRDYCDFLGTSLHVDNSSTTRLEMGEILQTIKQVGVSDLKRALETMFSHPTSVYGHGEVVSFPSLRQLGL
uniref:Mitochondrial-processing peptidase subunit alpha n=1 Tax=Lygus hesperus TaxID=30085 RepID=A0A146M5F2_LYGHE